jgi:DNA-binding MarR family transcriptional regulator
MVGALLVLAQLELVRAVGRAVRREGFADVTAAQAVVFRLLAPDGERLTALAGRAGMPKQSMGYLVEQLVRAGYLERVPDPRDGRAQLIRRTARGWAFSRAAARAVAELERRWAGIIGEAALAELKAHLARLLAGLGHRFEGSVADRAGTAADEPDPRPGAGGRRPAPPRPPRPATRRRPAG